MLRELVLEELGSQWFINEETPAPRPASAVGSGAILGLWAKFAYDNYGSSYVVKTVVHTVIAVSAEYGFALATAGTSMTGPSQVLETWVDTLFLAETSLLTATSLLNSSGIIEEGKQLIKSCQAAWTSLPQGLAAFYIAIKTIASNIVKNVAVVSYGLHQIAESIKKYLKTSIENIENYIKVLIPDATIGTAAAVAVGFVLNSLAINAFTLLATAFQAAAPYASWILDPKNVLNLFDKGFSLLFQSIEQAAVKLEGGQLSKSVPQSPITSVNLGNSTDPRAVAASQAALSSLPNRNSAPQPPATLNSPTAVKDFATKTIPQAFASLSKMGPVALREVAATLKQKQPAARQKLESIVTQLMPFYLGLLALYQIIIAGDYDNKTVGQQVAIAKSAATPISKAITSNAPVTAAAATVAAKAGAKAGAQAIAPSTKNENKEMLLRKVISEELRKQSRRSPRQRRS